MIGDENGLFPNETTPSLPPKPVAAAQKSEREFVQAWMEGKQHQIKTECLTYILTI
jgi:hypothetical protein